MIEFGSDFHYIDSYHSRRAHLTDVFHDAMLLADGRQCLIALIRENRWNRLWMPEYFCYEVIETVVNQTGIEVKTYADSPLCEGNVRRLPFEVGDVLLRMNFFGMRDFRSNKDIPVPVVEDHSHDPLGHWALYSDADWCISSIRKSLPLPEGGMMWSPKGHRFGSGLCPSEENEHIADIRWRGMKMKTQYLYDGNVSKEEFRKCYTETECWFDTAQPTPIDERSREYVSEKLDINLWQGAKRENWRLLNDLVRSDSCKALLPEDETCTMFSFILLFESVEHRNVVRKRLIESSVYPAILWNVPSDVSCMAKGFSERMLSIHCDGRYTSDDIIHLVSILNQALKE